jgi:hypothetical protein
MRSALTLGFTLALLPGSASAVPLDPFDRARSHQRTS